MSKSRNSVEIAGAVINIEFCVKPLFNTNQHSDIPLYGKVLFCILRIFAYPAHGKMPRFSPPKTDTFLRPFARDFTTDFMPDF